MDTVTAKLAEVGYNKLLGVIVNAISMMKQSFVNVMRYLINSPTLSVFFSSMNLISRNNKARGGDIFFATYGEIKEGVGCCASVIIKTLAYACGDIIIFLH